MFCSVQIMTYQTVEVLSEPTWEDVELSTLLGKYGNLKTDKFRFRFGRDADPDTLRSALILDPRPGSKFYKKEQFSRNFFAILLSFVFFEVILN